MEEWKEYKLGDICTKIGSGATPKGGKEAYLGGDTSLIRSQNVLDFSFSWDGLAYIDDEQAAKLNGVIIERGDVLLNITGDSVARACVVPESALPARVNQHVSIIRGNTAIVLNDYILYFLQYKKPDLLSLSQGGATRNALTKGMIEDLQIPLPPLSKQAEIVRVLKSFDDKIEVNRRINDNLEQQAQALFKSWFVDFEPFRDQPFVESELGMIPEGWRVGTLTSFGKIICGKTPSKAEPSYYGGDMPFIKIPDMHNKVFVEQSEDSLSQLGDESQPAKRIPPYSILVSCIATVGLVCINTKESHTNQQINTIIPDFPFFRYYLYQKLLSIKDYLNNLGRGGTATLNVNTKIFGNIKIIRPLDNVLLKYEELATPLFNMIESNQQESRRLAKLRDTLLPRLMSGEIKVGDVTL